MIIEFSNEDFASILQPHTDALVVTLIIANHNVHCILVDNGSSTDILYWSAFNKLNLEQEKILPTNCPHMGFTGEQVQSLGSIKLPVTIGTLSRQSTIIVHFLLVDRPSTYNAIIGRAALNKFGEFYLNTPPQNEVPHGSRSRESKGRSTGSPTMLEYIVEREPKCIGA